jgi:hydrogenase maturation protease
MGAIEAQVYVLGCEPDDFGDELEGRMGLSSAVQASVPEAVVMLETLITGLLHTHTVDVSNATLTR